MESSGENKSNSYKTVLSAQRKGRPHQTGKGSVPAHLTEEAMLELHLEAPWEVATVKRWNQPDLMADGMMGVGGTRSLELSCLVRVTDAVWAPLTEKGITGDVSTKLRCSPISHAEFKPPPSICSEW